MKIRIKNAWKSIPMGQEYEIPDFCIITGKNGSGKTHLLEAIENGGVSDVFFGEVVTTKRNYFPVNSLVPTVDPGANSMQIKESVEAWVSSVKSFKPEMLHLNGRASFGNMARNVEPLKTALISEIIRKINDDKKIDVCDIT